VKCRFCNNELIHEVIDLVNAPPSNSYITKDKLNNLEVFYPLKVFICDRCLLVQIDEYKKSEEIFSDNYAYYSSFSSSWLEHSKKYSEMIIEKLQLNSNSFVTEIASNDGYLLQYFVQKNIPCLGIEPTTNTTLEAEKKGVKSLVTFFNSELAYTIQESDLIIGNNVLAHVPDINDFVKGLKIALKPKGTITMEFPHILNLIKFGQFDTIYHEHYSYLSLLTVIEIFKTYGLCVYDVDEIETHGGSIRIYATHDSIGIKTSGKVVDLLFKESQYNLHKIEGYLSLQEKAFNIKLDFLDFLISAKKSNKKVIAYGAAAKGNTLLNYCGVKKDLINFVIDKSQFKQGQYLPGSHIPIVDISKINEVRPDYILILPWNLKKEIIDELSFTKEWGAKFVTAIPNLEII